MLTYGIPSYKLEKDVIAAEIDIIKELGAEIKCGVEVGKDITIAQLKEQGYKDVLYRHRLPGRQTPRSQERRRTRHTYRC